MLQYRMENKVFHFFYYFISVHCTLNFATERCHCPPHSSHAHCTLHNAQRTLHTSNCTLHNTHHYSLQITFFTHYTLHTMHCPPHCTSTSTLYATLAPFFLSAGGFFFVASKSLKLLVLNQMSF
jgi:hypothetical protein